MIEDPDALYSWKRRWPAGGFLRGGDERSTPRARSTPCQPRPRRVPRRSYLGGDGRARSCSLCLSCACDSDLAVVGDEDAHAATPAGYVDVDGRRRRVGMAGNVGQALAHDGDGVRRTESGRRGHRISMTASSYPRSRGLIASPSSVMSNEGTNPNAERVGARQCARPEADGLIPATQVVHDHCGSGAASSMAPAGRR